MDSGEVTSSEHCHNNTEIFDKKYYEELSQRPLSPELPRKEAEEILKNDAFALLFKEKFEEPILVVDLDRTTKDGKKTRCLNVECESDKELFCTPEFARKYYSQPPSKNQVICLNCWERAFKFYKDTEDDLRGGKSIFDRDLPIGNDVIIVDDEEDDDPAQSLKKQFTTKDDDSKTMYNLLNAPSSIDKIIKKACEKLNYRMQKEKQMKVLETKMEKLEVELNSVLDDEIKKNQEDLFSHMRNLYHVFNQVNWDQGPYNVPFEDMKSAAMKNEEGDCIFAGIIKDSGGALLPPAGAIEKPELNCGDLVYVMKVTVFSEWVPAIIEEIITKKVNDKPFHYYKVALGKSGAPNSQSLTISYKKETSAQFIAYHDPSPVRFIIGSRVIAEYVSKGKDGMVKKFYSGMIAEVPSGINNYRYLIFFEDGRVQYVNHGNIRLVCETKPAIWDHFAPKYKDFVKKYVLTYPERAMLRVKNLDSVKIEYKGFWVYGRVVELDCSLIHVFFLHDKHYEWIYRGSMRLHAMWRGDQNKKLINVKPRGFAARRTTSGPFVQYERIDSAEAIGDRENNQKQPVGRAVAKKSSTQLPGFPEYETIRYGDRRLKPVLGLDEPDGALTQDIPKKLIQPKCYRPHPCSASCISWLELEEIGKNARGMNPLATPVLYGFAREKDVSSNSVTYVAPCGKKLFSIEEVFKYLTQTKFKLSIDMFDFDPWLNIFNEFYVRHSNMAFKDLSFGLEIIPIGCVNTIDGEVPMYMDYTVTRKPQEGVDLNLDPEFLVGCDCTDNCQDKEKCACWQLTISSCAYMAKDKDFDKDNIGYQFKRLHNLVPTGIYECNSRCKCCVETCLNRVVQHPLKLKLQLFKTKYKGWGTRTLNDIPAGTFICVYVGNIFTEEVANKDGRLYGDEYFAELDYIEVVEANKEGYEDYVDPITGESNVGSESSRAASDEESEGYSDEKSSAPYGMNLRKRKRKTQQASDSEEEDDPEEMTTEPVFRDSNDSVNKKMEMEEDMSDLPKRPSVRSFYGENESVYIMDAKQTGNIGRYLNHSCDPNMFVQNVFVDTHDLRFPWVAFFSLRYIPAGTELSWDYRYEVDSVPGKKLKCYCFSENCRGRLL